MSTPCRQRRHIFIGGDVTLPCLAALDAVVVPIVLRDLFLLVLRLVLTVNFRQPRVLVIHWFRL
jgi:hypothetical protein